MLGTDFDFSALTEVDGAARWTGAPPAGLPTGGDPLATLRAVFQGPINFVDTAASYGDGESERRIGTVLRELGGVPDGFIVATKADRDLQSGDFSGDQMRCSVERSLRLLGLDKLQLVYLHDPEHTSFDACMAPGGPVEVLQRFKEQGVIEHLGVADGLDRLGIRGEFESVGEYKGAAEAFTRDTMSAPRASAFWMQSMMRSALSSRAPTARLIWARATRRVRIRYLFRERFASLYPGR